MEITAPHAIAAVVILGLGILLGYLLASTQSKAIASAERARSERLEEENNGLIERASRENSILQALAPIGSHLDAMAKRVGQLESAQTAASARISEQLSTATNVSRDLAAATSSLRTALTSTSARGTWGEVELERIVAAAGMLPHVHFETQQVQGSGKRPDLLIHLPGGGQLAVDAKVPLAAYLEAAEIDPVSALDRACRDDLLDQHGKAVMSHVKALAKRDYPAEHPGSPQVTVMFMPTESLLAEAVRSQPTLITDAADLGIALASPASLLALLKTVSATWATSKVTEEATDVLELGRELVARLATFTGYLGDLGSNLTRSVTAYNKAVGSLESRVLATARKFESLPNLDSVDEISGDHQVRQIT